MTYLVFIEATGTNGTTVFRAVIADQSESTTDPSKMEHMSVEANNVQKLMRRVARAIATRENDK